MAEVRKHRPRTSSIGDQVRARIDSGPRPVAPGERDDPDFDPFFSDEPKQTPEIPETGSAASVSATSGWFMFGSVAPTPEATSGGPSEGS